MTKGHVAIVVPKWLYGTLPFWLIMDFSRAGVFIFSEGADKEKVGRGRRFVAVKSVGVSQRSPIYRYLMTRLEESAKDSAEQ